MSTYTKELQDEIDRVTLKGNADKQTMRKLASIIFRMDQRIIALEGGVTAEQEAKKEPGPNLVPVPEAVQKKTIRPVQPKSEVPQAEPDTSTE